MQVAVFGMGYVGVVSAACLARNGHRVMGVDPNQTKTELINDGRSPIIEPGLDELVESAVAEGRLVALNEAARAIQQSELLMVCVGTPGHANGSLDLTYVHRVCDEIGAELAHCHEYKTVVMRSTMLPGSMEVEVIPRLERASHRKAGRDFGVCFNPEFLREGTAIHDFDDPHKTIFGSTDDRAAAQLRSLYEALDAPLHVTDLRTAEMVKYVDNAWHALKVSFANEVGRLSKAVDVDSRKVMELFCTDRKLNLSPAYLRPGFAFGGSCLPKDLRALGYQGRAHDINLPLMNSILPSNQEQIEHAVAMILATGEKRVGLLGLSFKAGTDDLRESPIVTLAERLIGKGYELSIYDRNVKLASLMGANRDYILHRIPHISRLLVDDGSEVFAASRVVVIATSEPEFAELVRLHSNRHRIIDLVGLGGTNESSALAGIESYDGIAW